MESSVTKPWYKNWWGIILAILIWPFFLVWLLWRKESKSNLVLKIAGSVGILFLALIMVAAIANPKTTTKTTASINTKPKVITTTQPTASIAALNAEVVPILTPVLTDLANQMAQGQADAAQPNAANVSSAFVAWKNNETDKGNVANNNEQHSASNKASNLYFDAHQTAPDAFNNWDSDSGNLPGDISTWASDEYMVLVDKLEGSDSTSHQAQANTDLQAYQGDLSKAQADIKQLQ